MIRMSIAVAGALVAGCSSAPDECTAFEDRTSADAAREISWVRSVKDSSARCLQVRVGQTVTWRGEVSVHPLKEAGGDSPSPIAQAVLSLTPDQKATATFAAPGVFKFVCTKHAEMNGAVKVVP